MLTKKLDKAISLLYFLLLFLVPLILFTKTSELFEFNKMVLTYLVTILILSSWVAKMIIAKKFIFRRTLLDIPLLIFLVSQILSTVFSIDPRTSQLGYYSRFHGGLASSFAYSLLYWAYVSNMDSKKTIQAIKLLLVSGFFVSIYGVAQKFGIDKEVWVQDVQARVFSTFGQPNWLAAWITALIPLTWYFALNTKYKILNTKYSYVLWTLLSALFFIVLLYTKSRSGLLGIACAFVIFWGMMFWKEKSNFGKKYFKRFLVFSLTFLVLIIAIGTPWTKYTTHQSLITSNAPALETGGTESGEIRKIVWRGALDIWKNYPVFGSGVETFAFSYYQFRPIEHNLVSEWEYLYNKAHNEYLNFLATTGFLGALSYLLLILFSLLQISNFHFLISKQLEVRSIRIALLAGYTSILVTNFFGFSVVPVALLFFLYPAMAVALSESGIKNQELRKGKISPTQKISLLIILILTSYFLLLTSKYWYADVLYAAGRKNNDLDNPEMAKKFLDQAIVLSPKEAVYWGELAKATNSLSRSASETNKIELSENLANTAIAQSQRATNLSPYNLNLLRLQASIYVGLSGIEPSYMQKAQETLLKAAVIAPTEPRILYNLALTYHRTGNPGEAIEILKMAAELKPNYRDAYYAMGLIYTELKDLQKAKESYLYLLIS